ncbi:MAG: hypothetical protein ABW003_25330 [Microvirga sp.]
MLSLIEARTSARKLTVRACAALALALPMDALAAAPMRSADFIDSIGVQTHLSFAGTTYTRLDKVLEAFKFLGILRARDRVPDPRGPSAFGARATVLLGRAGIKFNLTIRAGHQPQAVIEILRAIEREAPGTVASLEGYNEINHQKVNFDGMSGIRGAAAGQAAFYQAIKSDPDFAKLPVFNLTGIDMVSDPNFPFGQTLEGYADYANLHYYPQNGHQPDRWIRDNFAPGYKLAFPFPKVITEFGYFTIPQSGWNFIGVDEATQAKGIVNGIFDAARAGFARIYIYELLDQKKDPANTERESHFGLFNADFAPKPSAQALANTISVLSDRSGNATSFETKPLGVQVGASATELKTFLMQKSNGSYVLAAWREPPFWDRARGQPIVAPPQDFRLKFEKPFGRLNVYDPIQSREPIAKRVDTDAIDVAVSDHVVLVELVP